MSSLPSILTTATNTKKPLVSVIIPSWNHGHFVSEAIDSVFAQTYPHHEIIVVDDGSNDCTAEVVKPYPGVRYVRQENRGLSAARNRGIQESRGDYVVFLDADDRLLPRHFEISLDAFQSHPEAGWVCGDFQTFGATPVWQYVHRCVLSDTYMSLLNNNWIGAPHAVMYRRQVLEDSGGFDERLRSCEDWELYLRLSCQAPLYCHHQPIAEYRLTDDQMSRRWYVMLKWSMHVLRAQWQFVRGHDQHEQAYYKGISRSRAAYGERALWQMVTDARSGQWARALKAVWVLLRCYPAGLLNLLKGKAFTLLFIRKQGSL